MICDRLVAISPREFYPDGRTRRWFPVQHDAHFCSCGGRVTENGCEECGSTESAALILGCGDGPKKEIK